MKSEKISTLLAALGTFLFLIFVLPFYVFLPYTAINSETQFYTFEIVVFRFMGTVSIFVGILTFLWRAWSLTFSGKGRPCPFNPPEGFVVKGFYRYVRNLPNQLHEADGQKTCPRLMCSVMAFRKDFMK